jgi:hypothetical protein
VLLGIPIREAPFFGNEKRLLKFGGDQALKWATGTLNRVRNLVEREPRR